jgi:hypothetical protein
MKLPIVAGTLAAALVLPAHAADLLFPTKAPASTAASPWFVYMGLETGGRVTNHEFDFFNTGTGTIEIGGALAGALVGLEYKNSGVMWRAEVDGDYDFGRGGSVCMGVGVGCNLRHGGLVTERLDFGLPQSWLGGATPFVSVGAQQSQDFAAVVGVGSAGAWTNSFLAGAGLDVPMGPFSLGARWDHVWAGQAIALNMPAGGAVVANQGTQDVFRVNVKWRLN